MPKLFGQERKKHFPHLRFVQILGTNGKGSFCRELYHQLSQIYPSLFTFTSPHLKDLRERFLHNGQKLPVASYSAWQKSYGDYFPNFFEKILAFALYEVAYGGHFDPSLPAVVILEAGLGGRFDATSSIAIDYTVLLDVGADHQEMLGFAHYQRVREKVMALSPSTKELFCTRRLLQSASWDQVLFPVETISKNKLFEDRYEKSFARQWSAFLGIPVTQIDIGIDRHLLPKAASKVCSSLMKDLKPIGVQTQKQPFELKARQEKEVPSLKNTLFDVAHNSCALSFLIQKLKQSNQRKHWLLLSLEFSRLRHIDWIELLSFFDKVVGVEFIKSSHLPPSQKGPVLGALSSVPLFPTQSLFSENDRKIGDPKSSLLQEVTGAGVDEVKRLHLGEYEVLYYDPGIGPSNHIQSGSPCYYSKKGSEFSSLESYLIDLDTQAGEQGAQLVIAGSFYWMQEVFNSLKI